METTPDIPSSPKRRRFSADNPFIESSDTDDDVSYELPPKERQKRKSCNSTITSKQETDSDDDESTSHDDGNSPAEITFNGNFDDFNVVHDDEHNNLVLADVKKLMTKFQRGGTEDIEGMEEIKKTLQDLHPLKNILHVYVRFAHQLPSNFNSDSLCSLLCVAKQCNIKPYVFLTKVKTMEICKKHCSTRCGFFFSFVTRNTKEIDGVLLEKKFLGLKYTLKLLQSTVTNSEAIIGKISVAGSEQALVMAAVPPPQNKTRSCGVLATAPTKQSPCLYSKLWVGITHRWLAYHIVDHLFSLNKASSWTNQDIFIFSIQVFAPSGKCRSDFLNPLVGICLRFENPADISANQEQLARIRSNPSLFHSFGKTCLRDKNTASRIQSIHQTFATLKEKIRRKTLYRSLPLDTKWFLLQAYTYQLWLELSQNQEIKSEVVRLLSQGKKKAPPPMGHQEQATGASLPAPAATSPNETRRRIPPGTCTETPLPSNKVNIVAATAPTTGRRAPTAFPLLAEISHPNCDWNNMRLLSSKDLDKFLASYLIIRKEDGVDLVSRLSGFEVYSANNLHKLSHCRMNGGPAFYPDHEIGQIGQMDLHIRNKILEVIDVSSMTFHLARDGSSIFQEHGHLVPSTRDIGTLCRAVILHGHSDSKRCPGQRRAFIGNGGLDLPNGIPTTIVDGGFRKNLTGDPSICLENVMQTIGRLTEFLWRTMVDLQTKAKDAPMAPDRLRHAAYSNHLCTLMSMADCVSFEHITLAVSMIYPTTSDVGEHVDVMNDSVEGYTRTGTLTMCYMMESEENDFKLGLQLQVIGNFRRVIRQYLVRESRKPQECSRTLLSPYSSSSAFITYHPANLRLQDVSYNFGQALRGDGSTTRKIIFEGRNSRRSDGSQSYYNNYAHGSKLSYTPYLFKVATFCDKDFVSKQNIRRMKVLGHLEPSKDIKTQVNGFHDFQCGKELLEFLGETYGRNDGKLNTMRSASYHQQIAKDQDSQWAIFEGHVDKNFVHTAWFIPLTGGSFYTFVAVPTLWNIVQHEDSERKYRAWLSTMSHQDKAKLCSFEETFRQQALQYMTGSSIQVLIYYCSLGSFLSFPANICYHATVQTQTKAEERQMKDLLIMYPTEGG